MPASDHRDVDVLVVLQQRVRAAWISLDLSDVIGFTSGWTRACSIVRAHCGILLVIDEQCRSTPIIRYRAYLESNHSREDVLFTLFHQAPSPDSCPHSSYNLVRGLSSPDLPLLIPALVDLIKTRLQQGDAALRNKSVLFAFRELS